MSDNQFEQLAVSQSRTARISIGIAAGVISIFGVQDRIANAVPQAETEAASLERISNVGRFVSDRVCVGWDPTKGEPGPDNCWEWKEIVINPQPNPEPQPDPEPEPQPDPEPQPQPQPQPNPEPQPDPGDNGGDNDNPPAFDNTEDNEPDVQLTWEQQMAQQFEGQDGEPELAASLGWAVDIANDVYPLPTGPAAGDQRLVYLATIMDMAFVIDENGEYIMDPYMDRPATKYEMMMSDPDNEIEYNGTQLFFIKEEAELRWAAEQAEMVALEQPTGLMAR